MSVWRVLLLLAIAALAAAQDAAPPSAPAAGGAADEDEAEMPAAADPAADEAEEDVEDAIEEEEEADVEMETEAAPPAAAGNKASMQWVITAKMRTKLSELGYSAVEVEKLEPERAAAIIKHSIARPSSGVPGGWKRGAPAKGGPMRSAVSAGRSLLTAVRKPIAGVPPVVALVPAVLLVGGFGALSGAGGKTATAAAVVDALTAEPEEVAPPPVSDELWLDRQIDKLIALVKVLLGR